MNHHGNEIPRRVFRHLHPMETRSSVSLTALTLLATTLICAGCATDGSELSRLKIKPEPLLSSSSGLELGLDSKPEEVATSDGDPASLGKVINASLEQTNQRPTISHLATNEMLSDRIRMADGNVLIDFYADWCGPCRKQGKVLEEIEPEAGRLGLEILKVNVDRHQELAAEYNVTGLPTLVLVRDGKVVDRRAGLSSAQQLNQWLGP